MWSGSDSAMGVEAYSSTSLAEWLLLWGESLSVGLW